MRSPSGALLWELWRKNRWGLALSLLFLLICAGLRLHVAALEQRVTGLQAEFQRLTTGSLDIGELLAKTGAMESDGTIRIGASGYDGPLRVGDKLSWTGTLVGGMDPRLRVVLNETELVGAAQLPPQMPVRIEGEASRTISFAQGLEYADKAGAATVAADSRREESLIWSVISLCLSYLILFAGLSLAEPDAARGFTGIPPRQFALPVRTGLLVFWPLGLGALVVASVGMAWTTLVLPGLLPPDTSISGLYVTALTTAGLGIFQALVWGLASFPRLRAWLLTACLLAVVFLALPFMTLQSSATPPLAAQEHGSVVLALTWCLAALAAWGGVVQERRGNSRQWQAAGRRSSETQEDRQSASFGSPLLAQVWMEWRRNGRFALALWCVGLAVFSAANWTLRHFFEGQPWI